jgi:hypothetical protein
MLMPREPLRDRLSRRMTEQKNAKLAAAEKNPRPRVRSAKAKAVDDQRAVKDELRAVDQHAAVLRRQMEKRPEGPAARRLEARSLRARLYFLRIPRMGCAKGCDADKLKAHRHANLAPASRWPALRRMS